MAQHAIMAYSQLKMWILAVKDYSLASSLRSSLTPKIHSADPQILRKRQITEGNNIILGASIGYKLSKIFSIDASYAHAFIQNQTINVENSINTINGINEGYRDSISLKITANII